jgi:hypothetical protein
LIQDFSEFFRKNNGANRPWLITGPSVPPRKRPAAIKEGFAVLAIGDVAARFECDLALVVDIETIEANEAAILANADAVMMPRANRPRRAGHAPRTSRLTPTSRQRSVNSPPKTAFSPSISGRGTGLLPIWLSAATTRARAFRSGFSPRVG